MKKKETTKDQGEKPQQQPRRGGNRFWRRHQTSDLRHRDYALRWLRKMGSRAQPIDAFHAIAAEPS